MYRYIYISTVHLSEEQLIDLAARVQNTSTVYSERSNGYFIYLKRRDTHFFVSKDGLRTNLDDHIKVDTYEEYIQYVFENQLEN